jgi:hypothetical protein
MNITYRCMECGSNNIQVKVYMNLIDRSIVTDRNDTDCWCHACGKYTTYGWMELDEILRKQKEHAEV